MSVSKAKILILGATGKVGAKTIELLSQSGDVDVVAAVRSLQKAKHLADQGIELRYLDLDHHETLKPALEGIERALLITGYSVDMLKQSKAFLDAAKQAGVHHVVHIGASGAATNEVAHWGWHQYVECYIESLGFSFTHLRPEAFMQNLIAFGWLNRGVITNYIGNSRWSWIDCNDLALVAAKTLQNPELHAGKTYPLGYSAATLQDVADILTQEIGQPFTLNPRTPEEFLQTMLAAGADQAYMHCVYTQFKLNQVNAIPDADMVFNNFEQITGQKPVMWNDFVQINKSEFVYLT